MGDTVAALAIGVGGAVGLYLLWKRANAAPVALGPAPSPGIPTSVQGILTTAITNPDRINRAIFGVDTSSFPTFNNKTDAQQLGDNMCGCYKGFANACVAVQQQSPGLRCKKGDCDCNIRDVAGAIIGTRNVREISYRDSMGGPYRASVGTKVPIAGCRTDVTGAEMVRLGFPASAAAEVNRWAADNISRGYCRGISAAA